MRPLSALTADDVAPLAGVVFDLDDTLLDHGRLSEGAYSSLFRLKEAGLRLVGATGRPFGWVTLLARQWPVDAMIAENGAAYAVRAGDGELVERVVSAGSRDDLLRLAAQMVERFPSAKITDDNAARVADVTIDIGERCRVPAADVAGMLEIARAAGVATVTSSVHLHLAHQSPDKAAGAVRLLVTELGEDATAARRRYAFIGDSGNDATAFAAFRLTFGVANVRASAPLLTIGPRYVAPSPMGQGFVEIAQQILSRRPAISAERRPAIAPEPRPAIAPEPRPAIAPERHLAISAEPGPAISAEPGPAISAERRDLK